MHEICTEKSNFKSRRAFRALLPRHKAISLKNKIDWFE